MKKIVGIFIFAALMVSGVSALEAAAERAIAPAAAAREAAAGLAAVVELEGLPLAAAELEETIGGLPRCCSNLNYDSLEDKCQNNKGQRYKKGKNDCDIWVEKRCRDAGEDISDRWGPAADTEVKDHARILKDELQDSPAKGWNIVIIDDEHIALMRYNANGSADVYHQGKNKNADSTITEESRGYYYNSVNDFRWGNNRKYWKF